MPRRFIKPRNNSQIQFEVQTSPNELRKELDKYRNICTSLQAQNTKLVERIEELEQELNNSYSKIKQSEVDNHNISEAKKNAERTNSDMTKKMNDSISKCDRLEVEMQKMREKLRSLTLGTETIRSSNHDSKKMQNRKQPIRPPWRGGPYVKQPVLEENTQKRSISTIPLVKKTNKPMNKIQSKISPMPIGSHLNQMKEDKMRFEKNKRAMATAMKDVVSTNEEFKGDKNDPLNDGEAAMIVVESLFQDATMREFLNQCDPSVNTPIEPEWIDLIEQKQKQSVEAPELHGAYVKDFGPMLTQRETTHPVFLDSHEEQNTQEFLKEQLRIPSWKTPSINFNDVEFESIKSNQCQTKLPIRSDKAPIISSRKPSVSFPKGTSVSSGISAISEQNNFESESINLSFPSFDSSLLMNIDESEDSNVEKVQPHQQTPEVSFSEINNSKFDVSSLDSSLMEFDAFMAEL